MCHPELNRDTFYSTSIGATLRLPTYSKEDGLYYFLQQTIKYFKNNEKDLLTQVQYVKEELQSHESFRSALTLLSKRLEPHLHSKTGFVDEDITLPKLSKFFMKYMTPAELQDVSGTRKKTSTVSALNVHFEPQVNAVGGQRRDRKFKEHQQQDNTSYDHPVGPRKIVNPYKRNDGNNNYTVPDRNKSSHHCDACGTYGHPQEQCPVAGKVIHILDWLKRLKPDTRRKFLEEYKKNRLETHRQYLKGKRSRKNLKMRINQLSIKHGSEPDINDIICRTIETTKKDEACLDFGSMDQHYNDWDEPELDDELDEWPEYEDIASAFE